MKFSLNYPHQRFCHKRNCFFLLLLWKQRPTNLMYGNHSFAFEIECNKLIVEKAFKKQFISFQHIFKLSFYEQLTA